MREQEAKAVSVVRFLGLAVALALSGCMGMGADRGGKSTAVALASNNTQTSAGPRTGFFAVLDGDAELAAYDAQEKALSAPGGGIAVPWEGGAAHGTVTPGPIHYVNEQTCRDLVHVAERDHQRMHGRTTMCWTKEGRWEQLAALKQTAD